MRLPLFPWLLLLALASCTDHACAQCLDDQKLLLLQLRHNLSFSSSAPPLNLASWDTNTDCCSSWVGVECDENGYVIGIDLSSKFISGGLESSGSLFELRSLRMLNLSHNNFNSIPIPSGLEQLTNLTHLNLSNSGFAGQVPLALSRMTRLVSLDLSTLFAGREPLKLENPNLRTLVRDLFELRVLYLDSVNISMHGMEWCQALSSSVPNLEVLSLSNCYLSGPLDSSLLKLRFLSELVLRENILAAPLPDFIGNFPNLSFLDTSSCGLLGTFPEKIFQLPLLQILDVSDNQLQGSLPGFSQNSSLETLVLSKTSLSGNLPESIGNLRFLSRLDLTNSGFSGSVPSSISNLTRLHFIDLSSNNFTGVLPLFGSAENLTHINLAHNRLTGTISSSLWGRHLKLVNLNLRNNSLTGTIPSSLFTLSSLQKLDLSQNRFTGRLSEVPNGSSLMLDTLDFSNNLLEGSIPTSIFDISSLKIITLSSNNFSGSVWLDRFQKLRNLSSLDLSHNNILINSTGIDSASFPQVGTLKLASCNLEMFPEFLSNQSTLSYLDLSNNHIRGKIPNWIGKIGNGSLSHLNLSVNFLENPDEPFDEDHLNSLFVVDLHSNLLEGLMPILPPLASVLDYSNNKITSIPHVGRTEGTSSLGFTIFFSLSNNSVTGEIPFSLCEAKYLQVLDLSDNNLSGSIPKCLGNISTLRVLNLRNNELNGTLPDTSQGVCNLRTIDLNGNNLEGEVSTTLANCTMLEVLDLGNNRISGPFPRGLGKLSYLRVLVLRNNKFSDSITYREEDANITFQMLQIIDISSNNFTGNIPAGIFLRLKGMMNEDEAESNYKHNILRFGFLELSHLYYQDSVTVTSKGQQMELVKILTIFTSIDMSNNNFQGVIPGTIGSLSALYVLNLSRNALTGSIPSSLGNLSQLESLDLSGNKLTGQIPSELEELTFLSSLNLSFNQLVGPIPQDSQFPTFNQNVYEGNSRLCGPPLLTNCTHTTNLAPSAPTHENSNPTFNFNWQFIITGLGFGGGTAFVIAPLWFWAEGRKWYDRQIGKWLLIIISSTIFYNSRVDPVSETSLEQKITDEEFTDDYSDEEGDTGGIHVGSGRYCVFCTKLDSSMKRVVHNPKCSCQCL